MPRRVPIPQKKSKTGNGWLIVTCLAIFFFLFQWLVIYGIVTIHQCDNLTNFWLASGQDGLSPFLLVSAIFGLFLFWSLADFFRAILLNYDDKILSGVVFFGLLVCTLFIARTLWAQWEYFQIESGLLTKDQSRYLNVDWEILANDWDKRRHELGEHICASYGRAYNKR